MLFVRIYKSLPHPLRGRIRKGNHLHLGPYYYDGKKQGKVGRGEEQEEGSVVELMVAEEETSEEWF